MSCEDGAHYSAGSSSRAGATAAFARQSGLLQSVFVSSAQEHGPCQSGAVSDPTQAHSSTQPHRRQRPALFSAYASTVSKVVSVGSQPSDWSRMTSTVWAGSSELQPSLISSSSQRVGLPSISTRLMVRSQLSTS